MSGMDAASVQNAYGRWAATYDWTFGLLFGRGRRRAIALMELTEGSRAIEVGVGTGISMELLPKSCALFGVDFSRPMLERAARRSCNGNGLCAAHLVEGDGSRLPFADATFDAALAPFVLSACPDPVSLLHDMTRVCRPGAKIVVLNHFTARSPFLARIERALSPLTSRLLGFHTAFPLEPLFESAGVEVEHVERATLIGSWYVVTFTRR